MRVLDAPDSDTFFISTQTPSRHLSVGLAPLTPLISLSLNTMSRLTWFSMFIGTVASFSLGPSTVHPSLRHRNPFVCGTRRPSLVAANRRSWIACASPPSGGSNEAESKDLRKILKGSNVFFIGLDGCGKEKVIGNL